MKKTFLQRVKDNDPSVFCLYWINRNIGDDTAAVIADALQQNTSIKTVRLSRCQIGNKGAVALANMLKHNTTILELNLDGNPIGSVGYIALADALKQNTTLKYISLNYTQFDPEGVDVFSEMLIQNQTLDTVCWSRTIEGEITHHMWRRNYRLVVESIDGTPDSCRLVWHCDVAE